MFGTAQPALLAFPDERPVFLREYSTNHYSVISYFLSRLLMEAFVTFMQVLVSTIISYFMIGFQCSFISFLVIAYALAMASTALAVLLGCACRRSQTRTRDAYIAFCATDAFCRVLREPRAHAFVAPLAPVFVYFDICYSPYPCSRVQPRLRITRS